MEAQTALKKRELHTIWEEGLVLPLAEDELPTATLTLTLRTCDRFSRHSVAGELRLGLDGVSVPLGVAQWDELKTSVKVGLPLTRKGKMTKLGDQLTRTSRRDLPNAGVRVCACACMCVEGWSLNRVQGWKRSITQHLGLLVSSFASTLPCKDLSCHHGKHIKSVRALVLTVLSLFKFISIPCVPTMCQTLQGR